MFTMPWELWFVVLWHRSVLPIHKLFSNLLSTQEIMNLAQDQSHNSATIRVNEYIRHTTNLWHTLNRKNKFKTTIISISYKKLQQNKQQKTLTPDPRVGYQAHLAVGSLLCRDASQRISVAMATWMGIVCISMQVVWSNYMSCEFQELIVTPDEPRYFASSQLSLKASVVEGWVVGWMRGLERIHSITDDINMDTNEPQMKRFIICCTKPSKYVCMHYLEALPV